jgi:tripeptide aminopeptidase
LTTLDGINPERLTALFMELVRIDSVSGQEAQCGRRLRELLEEVGARVEVDDAAGKVGGNSGNLIARVPGTRSVAPLLVSAHMDTVEPGRGVRPSLTDGLFTSDGTTILGADDKSALAVIIEVLHCIREGKIASGPLEVVFSVCEETGLLGAKHLDYDRITARMGYVLDSRNPGVIVTRAPSADRLVLRIHGKSAHAGSCPEKGINAISVAAKAIAGLSLGRIDAETTCNLGVIQGGRATNIVPDLVTVEGEARSHDRAKLARVTGTIVQAFEDAVASHPGLDGGRPQLEALVEREFESFSVAREHPVVALAFQAAQRLGLPMATAGSGGGSDANVFALHGIVTGVLGTGMENVHTVHESIRLADMVRSARLLLEIIHLHAGI